VKGKAEPLALYRPLAARARFGADVTRTHTAPLVGRELEKQLLIGTFERSAQQHSCQLVTIVGEPGVGKSRLCAELFSYIEDRPGQLVRWRQGRCLPYGEGIAFWALGEIVKAECGILETDSSQEAEAKLERALPDDDPDLPWLKARLAPLVGVGGEPASQEESFTAWRRFLEALAARDPTVLVFEDLHWADDALLSFLEHLADWSQGVSLLILCTARPELHEQHPTWAAGLRNATTINLAPLSNEETARLIGSLLERAVLPAETQQALLERAGGNPLYAEEFVRLVADRGDIGVGGDVPDSVQDAAVMGKVFWGGALAEMGAREPGEVALALHEFSRKELVRPARTSSMKGESEYGFWHLLVRDVCYGQIPRAGRAARHRAAAAWLEGKAGERVEDLADVLAYHYQAALELTQASGQAVDAGDLKASAIRYLALSGERALALDIESAEQSLARALELAPAGHPERTFLLERWAEAATQQGRPKEAKEALEEALALHRERGESVAAGSVLIEISGVLGRMGDPRQEEPLLEALALLEAQPPGPELVFAYANLAGVRVVVDADLPEAIAAAERSLALAAELGEPESAHALGIRGVARASSGEQEGLEDMRRSIALTIEQGQGGLAATHLNNLALARWQYEGPQEALAACREGIEFSERRGMSARALAIAAMSTTFLAELGQSERALAEAGPLAERMEAAGMFEFTEARSVQLRLLAERGAHEHVPAPDALVATAREAGNPQVSAFTFAAGARLLLAQGRDRQATALLVELEEVVGNSRNPYYASLLAELVRTAHALGEPELAARLVDGVQPVTPLFEHAIGSCRARRAEGAGDHLQAVTLYAESATRWQEFGNVPERAYALLGQGRCLAALGKPEAEAPLRKARELFASMGYEPALAETDELLTQGEAAAAV
jgi:tetratricopeptide (TPR) repeat protein